MLEFKATYNFCEFIFVRSMNTTIYECLSADPQKFYKKSFSFSEVNNGGNTDFLNYYFLSISQRTDAEKQYIVSLF